MRCCWGRNIGGFRFSIFKEQIRLNGRSVIPGWRVSARPGISRFRVRCFASPRIDGVWIALRCRNDIKSALIPGTRLRPAAPRARVVHETLAPWRAWGMPGARCTRGLVCTCSGRTHTSNNEYTGTPGIPARNGFNGLCRALPGDRALLPPSPRGYPACPHPVGPTCLPQNLTPASGRQDHTILPSAATSLVRGLFDRSQTFRSALRSHRPQDAAASTASRALRP